MTQNAVDFLPEDYVEKRSQQRTAVLFTALFVAVMAGIIGYYLWKQPALRAAQAEAARLDTEKEAKGRQILDVQQMSNERQRMMAKAEVTAMLHERVPRSVLLAELGKMLPKGVDLLAVDLKSKEAAGYRPSSKLEEAKRSEQGNAFDATRPPPQVVEVTVVGMAPTDGHVATLIEGMGKCRLLTDVNLVVSEEYKYGEQTLRRFKVEMKLNPAADVAAGSER